MLTQEENKRLEPLNKEKILKLIKTEKWLAQGGQGKVLYFSVPGYAAGYTIKNYYPSPFGRIMTITVNDEGTWGLDSNALKILAQKLTELIQTDMNFVEKNNEEMNKCTAQFNKVVRKRVKYKIVQSNIVQGNLEKLSDTSLKQLLLDEANATLEIWRPYLLADAFDENWDTILKKMLSKHSITLTEEEISVLFLPEVLSYVQEEEVELCSIALEKNKQKQAKSLEEHQKNFFWYKNNYSYIESQPVEHFKERLDHMNSPKQEKDAILNRVKVTKEKKQKIYAHYNLPDEIKQYINFIVVVSKWRDLRKQYTLQCHYYLKQLVKEIGRRRNIDYSLFENMAFHEFMEQAFTISKEDLERLQGPSMVFYDENFKPYVLYGKDVLDIKKAYEEAIHPGHEDIKGMCACRGEATGIVKVINKVEDFDKMNKGDILVSSNTRPEFVPIMKKAGAIVTDEGGITSHAAVVSRELNVPCVIGTKQATKILKSGMKVQVDATKGIVTILD